jgi:predicted nucleotidyltransferase
MDEELLKRLKAAAEQVFPGGPILAAYAFGSRVSGRALPDSDLDVGYYLSGAFRRENLPLDEEMRLADALSSAVGCEVDLRNLAEAPLELKGRVLEDGIRIFSGDDVERVSLERDLLGRYHDYKDEFLRMHEIRLRQVAARGL